MRSVSYYRHVVRVWLRCESGSVSEQTLPEDGSARRTRLLEAVKGMGSVTRSIPPSKRGRGAVVDRRRKHILTRHATYRRPGSL